MRSNYIGGGWVSSASDVGVDVVNPATEQVIDSVPAGHPGDVDAAVPAARSALTRMLVHRDRYDEAVGLAAAFADRYVTGPVRVRPGARGARPGGVPGSESPAVLTARRL